MIELDEVDSECSSVSQLRASRDNLKLDNEILSFACEGTLYFFEGSGLNWQLHSSLEWQTDDIGGLGYSLYNDILIVNSFISVPNVSTTEAVYSFTRNGSNWENRKTVVSFEKPEGANLPFYESYIDIELSSPLTSDGLASLAVMTETDASNDESYRIDFYEFKSGGFEIENGFELSDGNTYALAFDYKDKTLVVYTNERESDQTSKRFDVYAYTNGQWGEPQTLVNRYAFYSTDIEGARILISSIVPFSDNLLVE